MTPFGKLLSKLRRARGLQQRQLAEMIGVNPCYISAIETGRKGPPSTLVIKKIVASLNLTACEVGRLTSAIESSVKVVRLPDDMSLEEYKFVWELRKRLGSLHDDELKIMSSALRLGSSIAREGGNVI
ncbi:helix-turn-helix domain-containing protein [Aurantivibrio plasticivorans]